jgi:class 3 adenylate cyclase
MTQQNKNAQKVLVVDDNPDNVELMADIVSSLGHVVYKAFDGPQALMSVEAAPPDLILLDVNMPGMSGFDVVRTLKADDVTSGIPIIMLTALSGVDYRVEGLGLGADDYLTKPYRPRELIARIETRLRAKNQSDDLRATQHMIRQMFERFVAPSVVNQLLKEPSAVKLGGTLQEITVLFADLENFTPISELTDPEKLLAVLNQYHELMVEMIQSNGGTVDKFMGDAVMALYNTPLEVEDHALKAVRTAFYIREALPEFHLKFEPEFRMNINFGIHTGMAVVGNVGAPQIMDFTAIGDTVNVAARMQGLSDGGQILISQATYERTPDTVKAAPIGERSFKGRTGTVMTYEILDLIDE